MPRGFSSDERDRVRQKIIDVGLELFGKFGIRKTNIEDITKHCGIAKGTFYLFFPSKEQLFLHIFTAVSAEMHQSLFKTLLASRVPPKEKLKTFLRAQYQAIGKNPIFNIVFNKEEMEYLLRKNPEALSLLSAQLDEQQYIPFIEQMKQVGILKDIENLLAIGELKLVFLLFSHRADYSAKVYDLIFERLLD